MAGFFDGFELTTTRVGDGELRLRRGGSGPPLLLLHGNPQSHAMWHAVAPALAKRFTVICPDLRGYGGSHKPGATPDHAPYAKTAMARDMAELMDRFGHDRFQVGSHDRGARVAHRLALDFPGRVERLAVLDIVPTGEVFRRLSVEVALACAGWFFLAQPAPRPETVIGQNPAAYYFGGRERLFHPEALADYVRCASRPATIHAMCEDYRAGISYDRPLDDANRGQRRITCPLLALWATDDDMGRLFDVLPIWHDWADDVSGHAIAAGHYLAEENPDDVLAALLPFLAATP